MDKPYLLTTFDQAGQILGEARFFSHSAAHLEAAADARCREYTIVGPGWARSWARRYIPGLGREKWRLYRDENC
ncbi:MAG: hypothetical protein H6Q00_1825 [Holophagaceae bacterium]|nr:hypothetical protein [Holophagaceae bacterium]